MRRSAAAFFTTYETLKTRLAASSLDLSTPWIHGLSASGGELAACLIRVPTEVIKTRAQTSAYGASSAGSWNAAKRVWAEGGLRGCYRGFGMTVSREVRRSSSPVARRPSSAEASFALTHRLPFDIFAPQLPFTSIQFPLYEHFKLVLSRPAYLDRKVLPHEAAICGSIAGAVAAASTTPLDVVKTRVMLEVRQSPSLAR